MPMNVTVSGEREVDLTIISARLHMTPQQLARHYIDKGIAHDKSARNKPWKDRLELDQAIAKQIEDEKKEPEFKEPGL